MQDFDGRRKSITKKKSKILSMQNIENEIDELNNNVFQSKM
jgi:hypothetical protein